MRRFVKKLKRQFPRLNITQKLVIAFLALGVFPLAVYGFYSIMSMSRSLEEQTLKKLQFQIDATGDQISEFLKNIQRDLLYLSSASSFENLASLQQKGAGDRNSQLFEKAQKQVEKDFLRFSKGKRAFYQLRYINSSGLEIVRMNRDSAEVYIVAKEELQDKSDRYYVKEALKCPPGEIYVSRMDLNIERGIVEIPLKPVVRYATPVINLGGQTCGVLIINVFAEAVFDIIGDIPKEAYSILTDHAGLYLYHSRNTHDRSYFRNRSLHDDYPAEIVKNVLREKNNLTRSSKHILASARIHSSIQTNNAWTLLLAVPNRIIFAAVYEMRTVFFTILILLVIVATFLGMVAAGEFTRPALKLIQGADLIAKGEFSHRIHVDSKDELGDLSGHFNTMARRLGQSQRKLQRWNEELQSEVERRTTELVVSEAQLKIEMQKLDDIVSSIGAEICLIDENLGVVWVNETLAERLNGQNAALDKKCYALFHNGSEFCAHCLGEQTIKSGQGGKVVVSRSDENGEDRIFQVVFTPVVDVNGKISQMLEMHLDITESVMQERSLEKQLAEKERLASQVQLAAGVIHEVAKPLASMKITLQVLEEESADEEQRSFLKGMENQIDHLSAFLRTFSTFARPRPLDLNLCGIEDIVRQVLLLVKKDAERRNVEIHVKYEDELPEIKLDPLQMQQVILNICINAFEAMPKGGVLHIECEMAHTDKSALRLCISDDGEGIHPDKIEKLFEPFYSDKPNGTGLGLTIVRQIIRGHGGELQVKSEPGEGASFILTFPA